MLTEEDLREKAEKRVKGKTALYIAAIVFSCASLILLMLSLYLPGIGIWLMLPIPAFLMVLGIMYVSTYGYALSTDRSTNWEAEAIEKEMTRLEGLPNVDQDELELKELERQKERQAWKDDLI